MTYCRNASSEFAFILPAANATRSTFQSDDDDVLLVLSCFQPSWPQTLLLRQIRRRGGGRRERGGRDHPPLLLLSIQIQQPFDGRRRRGAALRGRVVVLGGTPSCGLAAATRRRPVAHGVTEPKKQAVTTADAPLVSIPSTCCQKAFVRVLGDVPASFSSSLILFFGTGAI